MIISDLDYLETIPEAISIGGGRRQGSRRWEKQGRGGISNNVIQSTMAVSHVYAKGNNIGPIISTAIATNISTIINLIANQAIISI